MAHFDPGSFRDPQARVFEAGGRVYRALSEEAWRHWDQFRRTPLFADLTAQGQLVQTCEVEAEALPEPARELAEGWRAILLHQRVPFISYPYEWCFGMLRDAAAFQLQLTRSALGQGFVLKDASPYNIQWHGTRPVFIDVSSLEISAGGEPWMGYRQFCQLFLYPLLLQAYKEVSFHSWLRGDLEGIDPEHLARLLGPRDLLRPGVVTHVYLQARLQRMFGNSQSDLRSSLRTHGFHRDLVEANLARLARLVDRLEWQPQPSAWSRYGEEHSYEEQGMKRKIELVQNVLRSRSWQLIWDLGCNRGQFSRLAAGAAEHVVALDADHVSIELLYRELRDEGNTRILPLVVDLSQPSPGLGWRGRERKPLEERGAPQLVLCLALVHHLALGANVPLREIVRWLGDLSPEAVLEFPDRDDPMVRRMLLNKSERHIDYRREHFEECLAERFDIVEKNILPGETRWLYHVRRPA